MKCPRWQRTVVEGIALHVAEIMLHATMHLATFREVD